MVARWYGYFQTKNLNLGKFLEGLAMEHVGELYIHLVILRPFCSYLVHTFGNAVYNPRSGMLCREKSGNPDTTLNGEK
jgi:hypothetical protein